MKFTKEEICKSMLLYAVTDRAWLKENETLVSVCKEVLENGATFLQIREKDLDAGTFEQEANALKELCAAYHVPFVVNDSVEIAINIDADGVHVGQSDIKGRDIRAMIGDDKILGISAGTVAEAVGHIHEHLETGVSLCDVARALHVNKHYLCRLFKAEMGMTVGAYINSARVVRAKQLLRDGKEPIAFVASECGYNEPSVFAKSFKKETGMTPSHYRNLMRGR